MAHFHKILCFFLLIAVLKCSEGFLSESNERSLSGSQEETFSTATCPVGNVASNFVPAEFTGMWYETARYTNGLEKGYSCNIANYSNYNSTTNMANVVYNVTGGEHNSYITYSAYINYITAGVIYVDFYKPIRTSLTALIIAYKDQSYVVFYACMNSQPAAWLFTKDQQPDDYVYVRTAEALAANNIPIEFLHFKGLSSACYSN